MARNGSGGPDKKMDTAVVRKLEGTPACLLLGSNDAVTQPDELFSSSFSWPLSRVNVFGGIEYLKQLEICPPPL